MTDHEDHDTEAAPTEQASPPSTELPPANHPETPVAWSLDDTAEADSAAPRNRYVRAGYATLLAVMVGGILIPTFATIFTSGISKHAGPEAKPSTTVAVNAPPSAPTVASSIAPAAIPTPGFSTHDENFLSLMSHEGWGCTDNSGEEQCKKQMVSFAHQICSYSGQPVDLIYQNVGLPAFLGRREERRAISNAEQAYPNCTFTGSP
jgi:hypothetical protein